MGDDALRGDAVPVQHGVREKMASVTSSRVIVAIATYRRPDRLRLALDSLRASALRCPELLSVGVVVADDDPDASARGVAADFSGSWPLGCTYLHVGSRNISRARNAGLEAALPGADWVASIDDDVVVPHDWFRVCHRAVVDGRFDAVTGPLTKDFSSGPSWLTTEPFGHLGLMVGEDGQPAATCATGNSWVSAAFLRAHPDLRFDPELGRTGGEDMDFFFRAIALGLRPVYSSAAAVTEKEPAERCTFRYQVRRAFWLGISESQTHLGTGRAGRVRLLLRAGRRALHRGARQLPAEVRDSRGLRYQVAILAQCAGTALGTVGVRMGHR